MESLPSDQRKDFVRQAMFRPDGTFTDVAAPDSENRKARYQKQGDLLLWRKEKDLLETLEKEQP